METSLIVLLGFAVWWLGAAFGLASIAGRRGFDYTGWLFIGALFGPVIGAL